ncbi:MAG: hypothetical protein CBB69_010275 [Phycisphaera sp. TMED9]|nr:MAG: hypothetical protein CBB69_010275 [Phycisphaera sp. TMED9]
MAEMVAVIGYAPEMIRRTLARARRCSLVACMVVFSGCMTQLQQGFDGVRPGMTPDEVRAELGDPSVRIPPRLDEHGARLDGGRWQYADNLSSLANAAAFPEFVPDRVWVVWFDVDGVVQGTRRPIRVEDGGDGSVDQGGETPLFPSAAPPRSR